MSTTTNKVVDRNGNTPEQAAQIRREVEAENRRVIALRDQDDDAYDADEYES